MSAGAFPFPDPNLAVQAQALPPGIGTPAAPGAAAPPQMFPTTSTTTSKGGSRSQAEMTPEEAAIYARMKETGQGQEAVAARQGDLNVQVAGDKAAGDQQLADLKLKQVADRQLLLDQHQKQLGGALAQAKADFDAYRNTEPKAFWADKPWYTKVAAGIAMALGSYANALRPGTGNPGLQIIDGAIQGHYDRERAKIMKAKDVAAASREGAASVSDAQQRALHQIDLQQAATYAQVQKQIEARLSAKGVPAAQIAKDANVLAAAEHTNKSLQGVQEGLRTKAERDFRASTTNNETVNPAANRAPTESQAKTAFLAEQMKGEIATIEASPGLGAGALDKMQGNALASESADKSAGSGLLNSVGVGIGRAAGLIPKTKYSGLSPGEQTVANAWDNLTEKYARTLTGAGMPAEEARRMATQNAPVAGDSAAVIRQKFTRLKAAAEQMAAVGGSATAQVQAATPGAKPAAAPKASPKLGGRDTAAVELARRRLKANPNDAVARQVLQVNGVE